MAIVLAFFYVFDMSKIRMCLFVFKVHSVFQWGYKVKVESSTSPLINFDISHEKYARKCQKYIYIQGTAPKSHNTTQVRIVLWDVFNKTIKCTWANLWKFPIKWGFVESWQSWTKKFYVMRLLHKISLSNFVSLPRSPIWLEIFINWLRYTL